MKNIFLILTVPFLFTGCSSDKSVAPVTDTDTKLSVIVMYDNCVSSYSDLKNREDVEKYCKCVWNYESEYGNIQYNLEEAGEHLKNNFDICINPTIEAYHNKKAQEEYHEKVGQVKEKIYEECLARIQTNLDDYNNKSENHYNQIETTYEMKAKWTKSCKCEAEYLADNYIKKHPKNGFKSKMDEDVFESKLMADAVKKCH